MPNYGKISVELKYRVSCVMKVAHFLPGSNSKYTSSQVGSKCSCSASVKSASVVSSVYLMQPSILKCILSETKLDITYLQKPSNVFGRLHSSWFNRELSLSVVSWPRGWGSPERTPDLHITFKIPADFCHLVKHKSSKMTLLWKP